MKIGTSKRAIRIAVCFVVSLCSLFYGCVGKEENVQSTIQENIVGLQQDNQDEKDSETEDISLAEEQSEEVFEVDPEVYNAFFDCLTKNKEENRILDYEGNLEKTVAFCDIYGDENPEMIYAFEKEVEGLGNRIELKAVSYKDNKCIEILQDVILQENYVAGSADYYLFKTSNSKNLFGVVEGLDMDILEYDFIRYKEEVDVLKEEILYQNINQNRFGRVYDETLTDENDEYFYKDNHEMSEEDFREEIGELLSDMTDIVYYEGYFFSRRENDNHKFNLFNYGTRDIRMTYDEAVEYLCNLTGKTVPEEEQVSNPIITITWDESNVEFNGPMEDYDFISSVGLQVNISCNANNPDSVYKKSISRENGIVTETIEIISLDYDLDISVEPIAPTNTNPKDTVQAIISVSGQSDIKYSAEDILRRGDTGIWYAGVCSVRGGKIVEYRGY